VKVLNKLELEVIREMGLSTDDYEAVKHSETGSARNSAGSGLLIPAELEVVQRMGLSIDDYVAATGSESISARNSAGSGSLTGPVSQIASGGMCYQAPAISYARNSENSDGLTDEEEQICQRLGITELEFLQARDSGDPSDIVNQMIERLPPVQL
jgi:hypothetical protein